jgi:hypothetical protein
VVQAGCSIQVHTLYSPTPSDHGDKYSRLTILLSIFCPCLTPCEFHCLVVVVPEPLGGPRRDPFLHFSPSHLHLLISTFLTFFPLPRLLFPSTCGPTSYDSFLYKPEWYFCFWSEAPQVETSSRTSTMWDFADW